MDKSDISMEQAMGMMIPTIAAARECEVELFEITSIFKNKAIKMLQKN